MSLSNPRTKALPTRRAPIAGGITYHPVYRGTHNAHHRGELKHVAVHLDGRLVGHIKHPPASNGWHYVPKGTKSAGAVFLTVDEVKQTL
jgi:hypothetical protein